MLVETLNVVMMPAGLVVRLMIGEYCCVKPPVMSTWV